MTFTEAIIKVYQDNNNLPMTGREVWNKIKENNLFQSNGKTPWASTNSIILNYCVNIKLKKSYKTKLFECVESSPQKFRLIDFNINSQNHIDPLPEECKDEETIVEKTLLYQITSDELNWKKLSIYNHEENIEYLIEDCEEYTYIMLDEAHDVVKIGYTKNNPEDRLNQLKTGNPSIKLLHVFPSSQYSENQLHKDFIDFRKDLEWFYYAKKVREFINNEINKHKSIISSYNLKKELNIREYIMINKL